MPEVLPISQEVQTIKVMRKAIQANRALAELKGVTKSIPNEMLFIHTLTLREAKESAAIENIISTLDEVYQNVQFDEDQAGSAAKEVHNYSNALALGFQLVKKYGILRNNDILSIQAILEQNNAGFRKLPGTVLKNDRTGEVIYTPPQDLDTIIQLMTNLEAFINDDSLMDADPLVKMAIVHYQFESIHPFYDGNGRTGRIINILYLILKGLLELPILYLSGYIIETRADYYRLLQEVRTEGKWEEWILYMLDGVEKTALQDITMITAMKDLMQEYKHQVREKFPNFYSQDLINNLFKYPYTKIEFIQHDLAVSRNTAIGYLEKLVAEGILRKHKIGRDNFYENVRLFRLLKGGS